MTRSLFLLHPQFNANIFQQGGSSTNEPTQAIPAALKTKTSLLVGLWATGDDGPFDAQITALKTALGQWPGWTDLVVGLSVGSEDLYRDSDLGKKASAGVGANAATVLSRINKLKSALKGTALEKAPIGHVDTWTAWVDPANPSVIEACDWIGVDAYPYFQNTESNAITSGKDLFEEAISNTKKAVGDKPIWVTETGWPVSGKTENLGIPSTDNAQTYWNEVGCPRFGNVNIWWYTLQDSAPVTPNPSFGVVGSTLSTTPLYDLSCKNISTSSSSSSSASATSSGSSTLATSVASSGSGLSPTQGGGIYGGSNSSVLATGTGGYVPTKSGSGPVATGGANNLSSSTGSSGSGSGSGPAKTSAPTSAPAGATATSASAASFMSASFVAAMGAMFVAVLAL